MLIRLSIAIHATRDSRIASATVRLPVYVFLFPAREWSLVSSVARKHQGASFNCLMAAALSLLTSISVSVVIIMVFRYLLRI